ncbi:hypothetical protein [Photorhabdus akhurstii]|uniref:hypothetical protein n=1 Tax=Photorhabdus akhurstii TaxID=171438 RepID=UPI0037048807
MSDFIFPFQWRELSRAVEWLNERDDIQYTISCDDFISWWRQGELELCYYWEPQGLLVPDFTDFQGFNEGYYWDSYLPGEVPKISIKDYGAGSNYRLVSIPHGNPFNPSEFGDLSSKALVIPQFEMEKAYRLLNPEYEAGAEAESPKTINMLARFAKSLVRIHYGADVADNLRNELKNADSAIYQDFINANLVVPKSRALGDRLRSVDVDTIDN